METIDYPKRSDMVAALLDARARGVVAEVVGNGRTLKFPEGIGATDEEVEDAEQQEYEDALLGVVDDPGDGIEKTEVEGDTLAGVEEPEGRAVEVEDIIGTVPSEEEDDVSDFVNENTVDAVLEAVESGLFTAEQAVAAEQAGKQRKGILALSDEG